jgi:hypothetical protein
MTTFESRNPTTFESRRLDLTEDELHCLVCAMAGNFPDRFKPIRMGLLRKLAKARLLTPPVEECQ